MDKARSDARKGAYAAVAVVVVTLALFEAIAHRGQGPDAPGSTSQATTSPGTAIPAPGDR